MRKEIAIALLSGAFLGLLIAFGVWRINKILSPPKVSQTRSPATQNSTKTSNFSITLARPSENDVLTVSPTFVSGVTRPQTLVSISTSDNDYLLTSDENGGFNQEVDLVGGINLISLTAFDEKDSFADQKITVVYSSEFAKILNEISKALTPEEEVSTPSMDATESIRQKVREKVEKAKRNPKASLGTVTDITETTLQIKTDSGGIAQISFKKDETSFVKLGNGTKEIKYTDVAIGDYIAALGFPATGGSAFGGKNGNGILEAKRVLVTAPVPQPSFVSLLGEALSVGKKDLSVKLFKNEESKTVVVGKGTKIFLKMEKDLKKTKLSEAKEGSKLLVIAVSEKDVLTARTIFLLP